MCILKVIKSTYCLTWLEYERCKKTKKILLKLKLHWLTVTSAMQD